MLKLTRFLRPYRGYAALVLVLALAQAVGALLPPRLMANIVDDGIVRGDQARILSIGGLMLLLSMLATACAVAGSYCSSRVATGFGRTLRGAIFTRASHLSIHQFDRFGAASLMTRTTNDTTQVQQMLIMLMTMVITAPMMAAGGVILALSQDAQLAWVLIGVIPIMAVIFIVIMRAAVPLSTAMQSKIDRLNLVLGEGLSGVRVIRAFDRGTRQRQRFDAANLDATNTAMTVNRLMAVLMPALFVMLNFTNLAIIWVGSHRIDQGLMPFGAMISSLQYAMQILFAVFMVTAVFVMLPRAAASATRINEVLDLEPEVADPAGAAPAPRGRAGRDPHSSSAEPAGASAGRVEFDNVTFQYHGAEEPALSGVSFVANPGEVTAIIGGTGSGKSTLAGLIPRFYDVNGGRVLIDGVDVRDVPQAELRARIGFVPQRAVLFSGTVAANIRYGRGEATDDEVRHAATIAQAIEFIDAMPEKFDSPIAQGGINLSGGQKQRLAIARAIVRKPDVYVFDDSFSALDFVTDARLRAALRNETAGATVFIVAQRISTVITADRIIVLDNGRVVGMGTHTELLKSSPVYREIVASQVSLDEVA
ncbi:MAG TPA: ABC transporter ATP-binding protein [Vicinamibacterales bacterium]|nr:ABC transporter ATP-binding protein [Vicinamibacterales bacterium]